MLQLMRSQVHGAGRPHIRCCHRQPAVARQCSIATLHACMCSQPQACLGPHLLLVACCLVPLPQVQPLRASAHPQPLPLLPIEVHLLH